MQSYTDHKEPDKYDTTKENKAPVTNPKEIEIYDFFSDKGFKITIF